MSFTPVAPADRGCDAASDFSESTTGGSRCTSSCGKAITIPASFRPHQIAWFRSDSIRRAAQGFFVHTEISKFTDDAPKSVSSTSGGGSDSRPGRSVATCSSTDMTRFMSES